jgi:thiamine-monophosphate kinase
MSEFSIIDRYCKRVGVVHQETTLGVGDDAAILAVPSGQELVVSVDTMVAGVHFDSSISPEALAHKLMAVNLSDMAAMGATPKWATLALTMPEVDQVWLAKFSDSLNAVATRFGVELVGGDTTAGGLTASLQIMGLVPSGQALLRSTARAGDVVYVSGTVGDAALALQQRQSTGRVSADCLSQALDRPEPQVELGIRLRNLASATIDVSDGLVADLGHIARASEVTIELVSANVPLSEEFQRAGAELELALFGGDDYQLAFTAPLRSAEEIENLEKLSNIQVCQIGIVTAVQSEPVLIKHPDGTVQAPIQTGYQHFAN